MTNPKDICDALVEAGVLGLTKTAVDGVYRWGLAVWSAKQLVCSWLVAGAVIEQGHMTFIERHGRWQARWDEAYGRRTREWAAADTAPRAILEAWYQARKE